MSDDDHQQDHQQSISSPLVAGGETGDQRHIIQKEIDIAQKHMTSGYYFWYWIHVIFGLLTIILPASAALLHIDPEYVRLLAGLGALSGTVYAFLKPNELASGYDYACQEVWKTDIAFNTDSIDKKQVSEGLSRAITATTFKYVGLKS